MILISGRASASLDTDHTYRAPRHSQQMLFAVIREQRTIQTTTILNGKNMQRKDR